MASLLITLIWIVLSLTSFYLTRRQNFSILRIPSRNKAILIIVEVFIIMAVLRFNGALWKYAVIIGSLLLFIGWFLSYDDFDNFLHLRYKRAQFNRVTINWVHQLLGPRPNVIHRSLLGDWIQLVGLSLLWVSGYALILSLIVFPVLVHMVCKQRVNQVIDNDEQKKRNRRKRIPLIWPGLGFITRVIIIVILPAMLTALVFRDLILFWGTSQDAVTLISTLLQVEATVGVLIVTLLFVLVELTTSSYSPRLTKPLYARFTFSAMLIIAMLSLLVKVSFLSNTIVWNELPNISGGSSIILDWILLWSVLASLGYVVFAREAFRLSSPEALVEEALKDFNDEWVQIIRTGLCTQIHTHYTLIVIQWF